MQSTTILSILKKEVNLMIRRSLLCILTLLLITMGQAMAKGCAQTVTITGPGLRKAIVVRGAGARPLTTITLLDTHHSLSTAPTYVGPGYTLTQDDWDHVRYYPSQSGKPGYIFYIGLLQRGASSEYDGRWFRITPGGERALLHVLATHGVHFSTAKT